MAPKEKKGSEIQEVPKQKEPKTKKFGGKVTHKIPKKWYYLIYEIAYVILASATIILSLAIIGYALFAAIEILMITSDKPGLIVAIFVVIICAAFTLSALIYSSVYVVKRYPGAAIFVSFLLIIPFIVQISLVSSVINFTHDDERVLFHSLANLFSLSRSFESKYIHQFHHVEAAFKCCGLYDPNDYRLVYFDHYHPPDVPISCCPTYNPAMSDLNQEKARQLCIKDLTFYGEGCKVPAINVVKHALNMLQTLNWPFLALNLVMMALGFAAISFAKYDPKHEEDKKNKPVGP